MKKKFFALLLMAAIATTACGGGNQQPAGEAAGGEQAASGEQAAPAKDSIIAGIEFDIVSLDPYNVNDTLSMVVSQNIFEPLVRLAPNGEVVPGYADSWEVSDDGLEYTFKLHGGGTYHNGEPITAEDVKFSIDRSVESVYSGPYMGFIGGCEVIDDSTVKIILQYPYAPALGIISQYSCIVKESFYDDGGETIARSPIGSGPYEFVEWAQGDRIVMKAYDGYFRDKAPIENATFKIITDKTTAAIAVQKGEIDMYIEAADSDLPTLKADPNLVVIDQPTLTFYFAGLNTTKAPFDNVKIRQAIAMAIDREALIIAALDGSGVPTTSFIPEGVSGYMEGFDPLPYDPEKAKQILAEEGYPDGFDMSISVPEHRSMHAQAIQADLKKIGVNASIKILETGAFWVDLENADFDLNIVGWVILVPDPDVAFYSLYQSEEIIAGNYGRYSNPRVDELLEAGRSESDPAKRDEIYKEIETTVMTEAAYIPLYWKNSNVVYNKDLKNVEIPLANNFFLYLFSW